ncbi:DUF418 domain-containing protein [Parablastomonas sp. CN1-191]|uniref:DUF418 domain-containing protein n=1 Tax=Parablastomonas sp. CN1-191 TaxID=3400908 RepID=UPI003BF8962A
MSGGEVAQEAGRIAVIDLLRGIAVLGILAINITSFGAAPSAAYSPDLPAPGGAGDRIAWLIGFVIFEGKMRALFSLLFGAGLVLLVERAEAQGRNGAAWQRRRLTWLAVIGALHFVLLWEGDILLLYALVGFAAFALRRLPARDLAAAGLLLFAAWQAWGAIQWLPAVAAEQNAGHADSAEVQRAVRQPWRDYDVESLALARETFARRALRTVRERAAQPFEVLYYMAGETLAYQLLGMALAKGLFFAGGWSRRGLRRLALAGVGSGGAVTIAAAAYAVRSGFPEVTMRYAIGYGLGFAHLAMALGYAAATVLAAPRLATTRFGKALGAAGRMALSNYIGTSLVMTALFRGWGLGLIGRYGPATLWLFVLLGWALMLTGSTWWLARHRQGPLERGWRALARPYA